MDFGMTTTLGMKKLLSIPLMNGAGCIKTVEDVRKLSIVPLIGAIVAGSFTIGARDGNTGNVFYSDIVSHPDSDGIMRDYGYALNALGMPNGGLKYLETNLKQMVEIAHNAGKALIVNVAGFTSRDYWLLTDIVSIYGADAVELNLGCPNVVTNDGGRKPIPSFDTESFERILVEINSHFFRIPIWVKVSPNVNADQIKELAGIVSKFHFVKAITTTNTLPNSLTIMLDGKSRITVGSAGMSGPALKPLALNNAMQWRRALPECIDVIGVGGISHGADIRDYKNVGAVAFQMTTALIRSGKLIHKYSKE